MQTSPGFTSLSKVARDSGARAASKYVDKTKYEASLIYSSSVIVSHSKAEMLKLLRTACGI